MLEGSFTEKPSDDHCRLREGLLSADTVLDEPEVGLAAETADFPGQIPDALDRDLLRHGRAVVQLNEPLADDAFVKLGSVLGTAIHETAPAVRSYVEDGVVLNLRADAGITRDVSLQPFASNPCRCTARAAAVPSRTSPGTSCSCAWSPGTTRRPPSSSPWPTWQPP